jgi:hypothetical protein
MELIGITSGHCSNTEVRHPPMQRNSALHQVGVVNERLELTQQSNKVLQQQMDLFSVRYQMVLEDLRKESIKASDAEAALVASTAANSR